MSDPSLADIDFKNKGLGWTKFYNSAKSILIYSVGQKFKPEHCLEFLDYLFNFDQSDVKIAKLAQAGFQSVFNRLEFVLFSLRAPSRRYQFEIHLKCIIDAIENRAPSLIKELGLSVLVCCICVRDILEQNPLSTRLLSSPIPTEIIHFFSDFNWIYIYGNRLVTSFALFLSMRNNNNPSLQEFVQNRYSYKIRIFR